VNTPPTRPRILIIEDEQGLTRSLTWYFEHNGYDVAVARDGAEGLQQARATSPDAILLDLMLPRMDGLDVCRELRSGERTGRIPVVMMSAKSDEVSRASGYAAGADDYVSKPFSNRVLLAKVNALVASACSGG
jgi:two-component system, OmpR family, phosphate regulon response regulator PhoB